jgi:HAD superfamily hydrolase (TIGR01509 family)
MSRVRGVLLDLDGTVADSIRFFCDLTREILAEAKLDVPERAAVLEAIALGLPPATRFIPEDYPDRERFLERLYLESWPKWAARYATEVEPLPGACEAVEALYRSGVRVGLVTSSAGDLPFLDRWGIRKLFGVVVRRQDVMNIKPHPEPILAGLAGLGLAASEVWTVGDTPLDVRAGRAAGTETIGVLSGAGTEAQLRAEGAGVILVSVSEVPAYLDSPRRAEA